MIGGTQNHLPRWQVYAVPANIIKLEVTFTIDSGKASGQEAALALTLTALRGFLWDASSAGFMSKLNTAAQSAGATYFVVTSVTPGQPKVPNLSSPSSSDAEP